MDVTNKQLYLYAKRGILAEIEDWEAKREAVQSLEDVLTKAEMRNMLQGIDQSIAELIHQKEEIEKIISAVTEN